MKKTQHIKVKPLYMVHEDGEPSEYLYMRLGVYRQERLAMPQEETLKAMADMLDRFAEDCNASDFVGVHRGLAVILAQEFGELAARIIMRRLVNYDGLFGLVGVCGKGDVKRAEKELGVSLHDDSEWTL
jgi:hypothetical protein